MTNPAEELQPLKIQISPARTDPAWGYLEILFVVVSFVLALIACWVAGFTIVRWFAPGMAAQQLQRNPLFFLPMQLVADLMMFVAMRLAVTAKSDEVFWRAIHWNMPKGEGVF